MGKSGKKKSGQKDKDSDKPERTEEKPLPKLVLKVGKDHKKLKELKGEVSDASNHSESEHTNHHKKKKKKHKHRQDEEKKSRKRELTIENKEHETPTKKLHLRIPKEKEKKPEPKEPIVTPFQLCLENLHRNLQRKDVYNIFQLPVSDAVAPGYSKIIENPMDFLTMSKKIEQGEYTSIDQFKDDFVLMCNNALKYNGVDTIYYKSADKMLSICLKMLSKDKIKKMNKSLHLPVSDSEDDVVHIEDETPDVTIIELVNSGMEENIVVNTPAKKREKRKKESKKEHRSMIESILTATHEARRKLLEKHPKQLYGYLSKDCDGNSSLNILNPDVTEEGNSVPVKLENLTPKPKNGLPPGVPFKEDKKNKVIPVNYLLYGPYGSFGPTYDSSLSTTTKDESDLLLKTYGTELGVAYTKSIQEFAKNADFAIDYVNRILDSVTDGSHSRYLKMQENKTDDSNKENKEQVTQDEASKIVITPKETKETDQTSSSADSTNVDMESLLSLDDIGIDVSFLKDIVNENKAEENQPTHNLTGDSKEMLAQNVGLLESLKNAQYKRLSTQYGGTLPVTGEEMKIAASLTTNLKDLMKTVAPKSVVSAEGVKQAIGRGLLQADAGNKDSSPAPERKETVEIIPPTISSSS